MAQMLSPHASSTLFEDAIDVPLWLEVDRGSPFSARLSRDRRIAQRITAVDAEQRVREWWQQVEHGSAETGARLQRIRRLISLAMAVLGAGAGVTVALAGFHYTGAVPVNVVTLLAVLVVAPALLIVPGVLLLAGRLPGFRTLARLLGSINPGALAAAVFRRLARPPPAVAALFGWHTSRAVAAGRYSQWQFLCWSQMAAVGFNAATIATGVCLISVTDLAFGWSTTLAVEPRTVHAIVSAVAWPWRDWLPGALPDLALIEQSQFFRLAGTAPLASQASGALGAWWSFVILAIACYGLAPRVLLLALGLWRLQAATRALLLEDPRVTAMCDRMESPMIETAATDAEHAELNTAIPPVTRAPRQAGGARAVIWAGSVDYRAVADQVRDRLGLSVDGAVEAGGLRSIEHDRAALAEI